MASDQVLRFTLDDTPVRGQWVSLNQSLADCSAHIDAEEFARRLLGQALSAVCLLAATLKIDGHITLQIRGQGALHLLAAQATSDLTIRGLVRQNSRIRDTSASLADIFQADKMVITIERAAGKPYQGIVPLIGHSIAAALEAYFRHSEQLPTHIWLAADGRTCSGLLLQKMPESGLDFAGAESDQDAWDRALHLASTVRDEELLSLPAQSLLLRLFQQEALRLFEPVSIQFSCACSRQRTADMIQALGEAEARGILAEQGSIQVHCEYCNAAYAFDPVDVEQLFSSEPELDAGGSIH